MKEQEVFLDTVATTVELENNTASKLLFAYLSALLENHREDDVLYDLYFVSADNVMTAAGRYIPDPSIDFTQRSWYVGALDADGVYCESPYREKKTLPPPLKKSTTAPPLVLPTLAR